MHALEENARSFCHDALNIATYKDNLLKKFYDGLVEEARQQFELTRIDTEHWLRGALGPLNGQIMERRLLRAIINPAMILTWIFGLWLAVTSLAYKENWFIVKFIAVVALSGFHGFLSKHVRIFSNDGNEKPARYWRMMNEVPTVLMIIIVIMVVVKPF